MLPISDNVPSRSTPYVNISLIAVCLGVFVYEMLNRGFVDQWAFKPEYVLSRELFHVGPLFALQALVISIFLHGGILHIVGNMLALWVFGDNVEDRIGHGKYLVFYLFCGVIATLVHSLSAVVGLIGDGAALQRGVVGASGAIAGVMGAYYLLVPRSSIRTLIVFIFIITTVWIPSGFFIVLWFIIQLFSGVGSILGPGAGVAYWAHIGGFICGYLIARSKVRPRRPPRPRIIEINVRDL